MPTPFRVNFTKQTIFANNHQVYLGKQCFWIFAIIWMRGRISKEELREIMWGHLEDGGPLYDSLAVQCCKINQGIAVFNTKIISKAQMLELVAT